MNVSIQSKKLHIIFIFLMFFLTCITSGSPKATLFPIAEMFSSFSFNKEEFIRDLEIIHNIRNVEDRVILFSVFRRYFFNYFSKDHENYEELTHHLSKVYKDLKEEMVREYVRQFIEREGSLPDQTEREKLQKQSHEYLLYLMRKMHPHKKFKHISLMERRYLQHSSTHYRTKLNKEQERLRMIFEIARSQLESELQEHYQQKRSLIQALRFTVKTFLFAGTLYALFYLYRKGQREGFEVMGRKIPPLSRRHEYQFPKGSLLWLKSQMNDEQRKAFDELQKRITVFSLEKHKEDPYFDIKKDYKNYRDDKAAYVESTKIGEIINRFFEEYGNLFSSEPHRIRLIDCIWKALTHENSSS